MASGANNTFRQVGIATGIAVLGAVFQSQIVAHTTAALDKTRRRRPRCCTAGGAQLQGAMSAGEVRQAASAHPGRRRPATRCCRRTTSGFSTTLNHLMDIGAVVALVGRGRARFALVRQRDFVDPHGSRPPAAAGAGAGPGRRPGGRRPSPPSMPEPFTLEGTHVRLEPLTEAHIPALVGGGGARTAATTSGPTRPTGSSR